MSSWFVLLPSNIIFEKTTITEMNVVSRPRIVAGDFFLGGGGNEGKRDRTKTGMNIFERNANLCLSAMLCVPIHLRSRVLVFIVNRHPSTSKQGRGRSS